MTVSSGPPGPSEPGLPVLTRVLDDVRAVTARQIGRDLAEIAADATFFDIGADSLLLVGMLRELERTFGVRVAMRELFASGDTPRRLSQVIASKLTPEAAAKLTAAPAPQPHLSGPAPHLSGSSGPLVQLSHSSATPAPASAPLTASPPAAPPASPSWEVGAAQVQLLAQFANLVAQQLGAPPAHLSGSRGLLPDVSHSSAAQNPRLHGPRVEVARTGGMVGGSSTPEQRAHLDDLVRRLTAKTRRSKEIAARDRRVLADSRATVGFRDAIKEMLYPIAARGAKGATLEDVDGNRYVDITMGFGTLLFGHEPDFVADAIAGHLNHGLRLGPRSEDTGVAASLLAELTGMERVAFACTGSEAVAGAIRLARAATGRSRIVTFNGAYHGHADLVLGHTTVVDGRPVTVGVSAGIPDSAVSELTVLDYGDPASLATIEAMAGELAAVLVEPVQSRRPGHQPVEFLRQLRKLTSRHGVILMFDEMLTGLRCHPGGAAGYFDVTPDLVTYGKALGGGFPVGVIAGRADIMDGVDGGYWQYGDDSYPPQDTAFFGGTYLQHPVSMTVARAVLERIKAEGPQLQQRLNARTGAFAAELNGFFAEEEFPVRIVHFGSQFRFEFHGDMELLYYHLLLRGVYVWEWRSFFWSTAHTDADVRFVIDAVQESLREMRRGGFFPRSTPAPPAATPTTATATPAKPSARTAPVTMPDPVVLATGGRPDFSVYFFGDYPRDLPDQQAGDKYDLIVRTTRFADRNGFHAAWLPERHFNSFGGLFPNPSVLAAALAGQTSRIRLHAGSVVLPLHHPIRVAEEWSVVDNLSGGRVGLCVASGWHANDFAFYPDRFGRHRELMYEQLDQVRQLWRGDPVPATSGSGEPIEVQLYPKPVQPMPPCYAAVVGNPDSYRTAARLGLGIVTNLMTQSIEQVAERIGLYRNTRAEAGLDPDTGRVVVLMHTYLGDDLERVRADAFDPFCRYLRSSLGLIGQAANSLGMSIDVANTPEDDLLFLLGQAYQRYCESRALIGTPDSAQPIVDELVTAGVDEVAYFVDFGVPPDLVLASLPKLAELRDRYPASDPAARNGRANGMVAAGALTPTAASDDQLGGAGNGDGVVETAPLSYAQERIWLLEQLFPEHTTYNEVKAVRLVGPLDVDALRAALRQLMVRHAALRTVIREVDGKPHQVVLAEVPMDCPIVDHPAAEPGEATTVREEVAAESRTPFDLVAGPLLRTRLLRFAPDRHVLILGAHHAVIDTVSSYVVGRELSALYRAYRTGVPTNLPELKLSYPDYARAQRRAIDGDGADPAAAAAARRDLAFWLDHLAGELPVLALPTDRPRPAVLDPTGAAVVEYLPAGLSERARGFSATRRTTLFMTLLAAFSATLGRLAGQDDLVVGAAVTDRPDGAEHMVGVALNTLPLRVDATGDPSFSALLDRVRDTMMDAYEHGGTPFERMLEKLNPRRDTSRAPLFQAMLIYENEDSFALDLPEVSATSLDVGPDRALFDLTAYLANLPSGIRVHLEYNTVLFDESTVRGFAAQFEHLLAAVLAEPDRPMSGVVGLTDRDRQLLAGWQYGPELEIDGVDALTVGDLVASRADEQPDAPAVETPSGQLSYRELVDRADELAARLAAAGVGRDDVVAVQLPRSAGLVVAQLGVLRAGAGYLPIDPALPAERRRFMLTDAECTVLVALTGENSEDELAVDSVAVLKLDGTGELTDASALEWLKEPSSAREPLKCNSADDLAYVIYTSGSTGKPKGVLSTHRGAINLCRWYAERTGMAPGDRATFTSAIGFDGSALELWPALVAGATVVVADETARHDPHALAGWLTDRRITVAWLTTALTEALLAVPGALDVPTRVIVTGGAALRRRPPAGARFELVNSYGPTEASVIVSHGTVTADDPGPITIGRPSPNTSWHVLDAGRRPVPVGAVGELYLGGAQLARGYLNRPALTAERFVTAPTAAPGERLYRTGDLVRWTASGELEFLGRTDDQVKIRGYRVEPGEVAHTLLRLSSIREAVVLAQYDKNGDGPHLAAYVVPDRAGNGAAPGQAELMAALDAELPDYMVPRRFAFLDRLPLGSSGKVDRAALPPAEVVASSGGQPATPAQRTLHELWCAELDVTAVDVEASFFDLGGDSLAAARLLRRIRAALDAEYPLLDFFRAPTIAAMAARLDRTRAEPVPEPEPVASGAPGRVRGSI